ncbi:RagB/SusD family nutrient uptake outer membrane protein [Hymenobacter sp. BT770]|uniref:RagB/SusD family nutrient uptake outer membrane protein n=1 Tax=Hymenobacter sp. BT770 TaxID=2886942 RepID=UPI001D1248DD|nr:RagB/SusD family nutrient uptake outer membrane protein [Hymenobacter sp. BT770]MCC3153221.1 RagB/SusD family nutrient uptake outer membrane protein [Hymenobacter sp. BT770]MDO3414216.1 RagB/SusD family nutrient uptake outer membrane protein [Hymenobacter sp. BT770]
MKRILFSAAALLGLAQGLSSCKKDFLDENPQSLYTPQTTLVDSLGFEAGMTGLQAVVRDMYTTTEPQGLLGVMQVGTDAVSPAMPQGVEVPYYNYEKLQSQDGGAAFYWTAAYRIINNANILIQAAANAPSSLRQGYKNRITAEARFYRAYAYNFLTTLYGAVPLVLEPIATPRTDFTRAPVAEVNTAIINDLTTAIPNLFLANKAASGRITQGAARQLLAEVYLRTNQANLAEQQCQAILTSNQYKLITARFGVRASAPGDYYSDMFIIGNQRRNQGNTEIIWGIEQQLNVPGGQNGNGGQQRRMWVPGYYNITGMLIADSLGGRGIGRMRLSQWVDYRLYAAADMRNSKYNLKRKFYYNDPSKPALYGKRVIVTGSDTSVRITPYITKWNMYNPVDEFGLATVKDLPMMRLGETYLLLAEAQLKQGNTAGAATSINVLRTRAQAAQVTAANIDLNFILDERARELIGEENRRITLVRTGTLIDRVTRLNGSSITGLRPENLLLPIPQSEIDRNVGGGLTQNPGY